MITLGRVSKLTKGVAQLDYVEDELICRDGNEIFQPGGC